MKEKLAEIADSIEKLFPNGKGVLVFELNDKDFQELKSNFNIRNKSEKQFKIDISGTEIIFILDELLKV